MNNLLLLFFALPIAVIIISIALQRLFRSQLLVAGIIFAILLVVTFVIGDLTYLVATIAYTFLAYITAILTKLIYRLLRNMDGDENDDFCCGCGSTSNNNGTQVLSITGKTVDNNDFEYPTYDTNAKRKNREEYRCWKR